MKLVLELGQREPQEMLGFRQKNFVPFPLEGGTDTKQQGCWAQRGGPLLDMWQTQIAEYIIHIHVEKGCASKDTSHDPELGIVVCKHSGHKYLKKKNMYLSALRLSLEKCMRMFDDSLQRTHGKAEWAWAWEQTRAHPAFMLLPPSDCAPLCLTHILGHWSMSGPVLSISWVLVISKRMLSC